MDSSAETVTGTASCHCGKVSIEFTAPADIDVVKCNCSICALRMNHHFILPHSKVQLSAG